jgi:hypothetical protein
MSLQCITHGDNSLARKPGTTRNSTRRDPARRKSSSTNSTAARASGRNAAQQNGTSDVQATTLTSAQKRQPRTSQKQASSQPGQSAAQRRQVKSGKTSSSASEQRSGRGTKLVAMLSSPAVRNVVAAGLVSAAAALLYRKPTAIAAANESVQEAATELLDGAVIAGRATTKAVRKVGRKAVTTAEAVATASASATQDTTTAQSDDGSSSLKGSPETKAEGTTTAQQRTRKRRSDAGVKRGSRATTLVAVAPISSPPEPSLPPVSLDKMETSAFAFGAQPPQPTPEAAPAPVAAEEQVAEAHPS